MFSKILILLFLLVGWHMIASGFSQWTELKVVRWFRGTCEVYPLKLEFGYLFPNDRLFSMSRFRLKSEHAVHFHLSYKSKFCSHPASARFPLRSSKDHPNPMSMDKDRDSVRKIWSDGRFVVGGVTALKVGSILEPLIGYHGFRFKASDWSALLCILSWTPPQHNNNNASIDFQGCFKEHSEMHLFL